MEKFLSFALAVIVLSTIAVVVTKDKEHEGPKPERVQGAYIEAPR